ncbi:MAG: hypothetical protein U1F33_17085 [Alphaproteobacteria bacterium]
MRIQALDPFNPDGVGLLEPPEGLGADTWKGTSRARIDELIARLNQPIRLRAGVELLERLLLSVATPPAGAGARSFLALRADMLAAQGDIESAVALIRAAPAPIADAAAERLRVDQMLLAADTNGACGEIGTLVRTNANPYWQKAQIYCQAAAGQRDAAALGLDVLREQGQLKDAAFESLARALINGREPTIESLPDPTALHLAMVRAARLTPPSETMQTRDARTLAAIANGGSTDLLQRIAAAERLEAAGVFQAEALARLYDRVPFRDDEFQHALAIAEAPYGVRGRALLYRTAARLKDSTDARIKVVERALTLARTHGLYGTALRTNGAFILGLTPGPEVSALAEDGVRAALGGGRVDAAGPWLQLMRTRATPATRESAASLEIAMRLAGARGTREGDEVLLKTWLRSRKAGAETTKRAAVLAALLDSVRPPEEPEQWKPPLASDPAPSARPLLSRELRQAAAGGRKGEVVLLSLNLLAGQDPTVLDPAVLGLVIPALVDVGLEADARRMAVEIAIAGGT